MASTKAESNVQPICLRTCRMISVIPFANKGIGLIADKPIKLSNFVTCCIINDFSLLTICHIKFLILSKADAIADCISITLSLNLPTSSLGESVFGRYFTAVPFL